MVLYSAARKLCYLCSLNKMNLLQSCIISGFVLGMKVLLLMKKSKIFIKKKWSSLGTMAIICKLNFCEKCCDTLKHTFFFCVCGECHYETCVPT